MRDDYSKKANDVPQNRFGCAYQLHGLNGPFVCFVLEHLGFELRFEPLGLKTVGPIASVPAVSCRVANGGGARAEMRTRHSRLIVRAGNFATCPLSTLENAINCYAIEIPE